eukprot:315666-Rhodomonas_salina.1
MSLSSIGLTMKAPLISNCSTTYPVTLSNSLEGNGTDLTLATRDQQACRSGMGGGERMQRLFIPLVPAQLEI